MCVRVCVCVCVCVRVCLCARGVKGERGQRLFRSFFRQRCSPSPRPVAPHLVECAADDAVGALPDVREVGVARANLKGLALDLHRGGG